MNCNNFSQGLNFHRKNDLFMKMSKKFKKKAARPFSSSFLKIVKSEILIHQLYL